MSAGGGLVVRWPPLTRRVAVLGLGPAQVAALVAGAVAALLALRAVPGALGLVCAVGLVAGGAAAGCWPLAGDPPVRWLSVVGAWLLRRHTTLDGAPLDGAPLDGAVLDGAALEGAALEGAALEGAALEGAALEGARRAGPPPGVHGPRPRARRHGAGGPAGLTLRDGGGGPGEAPLGVVEDRRHRRWAAVLPVTGPAMDLLDPASRADLAGRWSSVLAGVAHPGSAVCRLQWVAARRPADPRPLLAAAEAAPGPAAAAAAYRSAVARVAPTTVSTTCLLVVAVGTPGHRPEAVLRREVRLLTASLRAVGLAPGAPLDPGALSGELAAAVEPTRPGPPPGAHPWPLAVHESWSHLRTDAAWHATWWVAGWPQVPVGPELLSPLLAGPPGLTVSLVMAPVAAERAVRAARAARTAAMADGALRERAGFLATAAAGRRAEAATRREQELADGHAEHRCSAYVTASAASGAELDARCGDVERSAGRAGLELRRLHGRQAEARTWTLPLARGVR